MAEETEILAVMESLARVETWCKQTNTAGSALGRTACGDQAILSRWRHSGITSVSPVKRHLLAVYILDHPDGIPGYKKQGGRKALGKRFIPNATKIASSRSGKVLEGSGSSTPIPVPGLSQLEYASDVDYIKTQAFSRGCPIVQVMAELLHLGITCAMENDREEL